MDYEAHFVAGKLHVKMILPTPIPDHLEVQLDLQKNWVARPNRTLLAEVFTKSGGKPPMFIERILPRDVYIYIYILEYEPECQSSPR